MMIIPDTIGYIFALLFLCALFTSSALRLYLLVRQRRHIAAHRTSVPAEFSSQITLEKHQLATDYNNAKLRLAALEIITGAAVLLAFTLGGGLATLSSYLITNLSLSGMAYSIAFIVLPLIISSIIDLPFSLYKTFVIEQRFGFNRMTWQLYLLDMIKGLLLSTALGLPLLAVVLYLFNSAGSYWWVAVWAVWMGFNLLMLFIWPNWIAPLFNKFEKLSDESLANRINQLLQKCGFQSDGLFVMDGSRRSAHGNAYFTGFGRNKRIVFFDTLLEKLQPEEIEAVLAHELGHFKHKHITQMLVFSALSTLAILALLAWLIQQNWFFTTFGLLPGIAGHSLLLFMMILPVFSFPVAPLMSFWSRKNEYQADRYAAANADPGSMITALVKLYRDNASVLSSDPLYSRFHDSHPPASLRIAALKNYRNNSQPNQLAIST